MITRFRAARLARQLTESAIHSRRALRRLATVGTTLAFLLTIVGPAVVFAVPSLAFDDDYVVAQYETLTVPAPGLLANDAADVYVASTGGFSTAHGNGEIMTNGSFAYTSHEGYQGNDTFNYTACVVDTENCDTATATITVGDWPHARDDSATVLENSSENVIDAMANDVDPNGQAIEFYWFNQPAYGSVSQVGSGSSSTLSYTPDENFDGIDSFTYGVWDQYQFSNEATVTITVTAVNDAPSFSGGGDVTVLEDAAAYSAVWATAITPGAGESDAVSFGMANDNTALFSSAPAIDADGTLTFTVTPNAFGVANMSATISDDGPMINGGLNPGNTVDFTITVSAVPDDSSCGGGDLTVSEDLQLNGNLGTYCSDPDGSLTFAIAEDGDAAHGTLVIGESGAWSFTSDSDFNGSDAFTYSASDSEGVVGSGTIALTISAANDAPVAVADSYNATEDTTLTVGAGTGVLTNDTDVELSELSAIIVANADRGTVTLNGTGAFVYVPDANYNGTDTFTYRANDGTIDGNTVTVTIAIAPVNDLPVAVADSETVVEDTSTSLNVLVNDTDVDLDILKVLFVGPAEHGTASVPFGGLSVRYVPNANYVGADSFDYTITDSHGGTWTATVTVNVTAVNDTPVCWIVDNTVSVGEDGSLPLAFSCTDIENTSIVHGIGTSPTNGVISSLDAGAGTFTYSPNLNYNGLDSFTIVGSDGVATSAPITITVTVGAVNDAPLAVADAYTTAEESTLIIDTTLGVLANDSDVELSAMTASVLIDVSHGALTFNANGSFSYVPNVDFNGPDFFTYRANDGSISGNTVAVSINVTAINDAPTAVDGSASTDEDTAVEINLANFSSDDETGAVDRIYTIVAAPGLGELSATSNILTYTPDFHYNGSDTFTFKVTDRGDPDNCGEPVDAACAAALTSTTQTITITIGAVNDAPVAVADSYSTSEDETAEVGLGDDSVLFNDTDLEENALTAVLVTDVSHGDLDFDQDGGFTYTPDLNFNGTDSFTYRANDGTESGTADGNTVTVTLSVQPINDHPIAIDETASTDEDIQVGIDLSNRATDIETDDANLSYTIVAGPTDGELTGSGAELTYTPDTNFNGTDTFTFSVTDRGDPDNCGEPIADVCTAAKTSEIKTITLTIGAVNDAPVALDDAYATNEDATLAVDNGESGNILDNDSDVDNTTLTAVLVTDVSDGNLTLLPGGTFWYAPDANFNGTDSFTYQANDGNLDSNVVTVTITIVAVNDVPVSVADAYASDEDAVKTGNVLSNDSDVEVSDLTAVLLDNVSHGYLVLETDGSFSYAPTANFNGPDSFTYVVNDGTVDGDTVTVTLTVHPINDDPIAVDGTALTTEDNAVAINLGDSTVDVETTAGNLSYTIVAGPTDGALTGSGPEQTYTPDTNFSGTDTFTYSVTDRGDPDKCGEPIVDVCTAAKTSEIKTITITIDAVNDAPVATADAYSTAEDTTLDVTGEDGTVLTNDTDVDNTTRTAVLVSDASNGILALNYDGTFTYAPDLNFHGTDSFTYKANDETETETAYSNVVTVTITVNAVNDAVIAVADDFIVVEDSANTLTVLANDIDVDLETLRVTLVGGASHGLAYIPFGGSSVRYIPDANFGGSDTFDYTVTDGHGTTSSTTVTITVTPVNDSPVAVAESYGTEEGTTLTVVAEIGVLVNDSDVDEDHLVAFLVSSVSHGELVFDQDGSFTYTPTAHYSGTDTFTYQANDITPNENAAGNIVTVTIAVGGLNDAPVAAADAYTTAEDTTATGNVLTNDTDLDGDVLNAVLVTDVSDGSLTLDPEDGSFSYTPAANFSGTDAFTYRANDGSLDSNIVTVTITIDAVNDAPVVGSSSTQTSEDTTYLAYVLNNASDVDGDTLHVLSVGMASHGMAYVPVGAGAIIYIPDLDFNGQDSFEYTVSDGHGGSGTATLTLNVLPINDIPVCTTDETAVSMAEDAILALAFGCTDVDADTTITYGIGTAPSHGSITLLVVENGTFTYVPNVDYNGTDTFTIVGSDGVADSAPITITVTIRAINDSPVSVADTYATNEDATLTVGGETGNVLDNDSDVEISAAGEGDGDVAGLTAVLVTDLSHGVLDFASNGTFTYAPNANFNGTDSFTYKANDGTETDTADGNIVTVTITVNPQNDAPVAAANTYTKAEDTTWTGHVLTNDTDLDGDSLTAVLVRTVGHGNVSLQANGAFTYTPTLNFNGTDSFTYQANDGTVSSNIVTVTIRITPVNDGPVAVANTYTKAEDTSWTGRVLNNDADVDGDSLTSILVTDVSHGTLSLGANGTFSYTANLNFNGTDSFTYVANDGALSSNTATVTIRVTPVNDAPVALPNMYTKAEDTTWTGRTLNNDTDVDGDSLTAVLVTSVSHGTLSLGASGTFTYTPNLDFTGIDSFTYTANDGTLSSNTATVTIKITPVTAPVAFAR